MLTFFSSLESKFFIYLLSQRRNFIPILSIYFLSLPDTTAQQLWIFTAIWYFASFLLEIPSGYISDRFWHKRTLILSKILQALSVLLFIIWYFIPGEYNFYVFVIAMITQTIWFSFFSWTTSAYFHEILEEQGRGKEYWKELAHLRWKVSLLSAFIILALPFLTTLHILWPFIIWFIFDILWLIVLFFLPKWNKIETCSKSQKSILQVLKEAKQSKSLHVSIFLWLAIWFFLWEHPYRTIYLQDLWYPIVLIWAIMAWSRIVWFLVWKYAYILERIFTFRQHLFFETILFPVCLFMVFFFSNPYLVSLIFIFMIWYQHGRKPILEQYLIDNHISDKRYKATLLSLESQVSSILSAAISFGIGFIMAYSYKIGYLTLSAGLFFCMIISFYFIFRNKKWEVL